MRHGLGQKKSILVDNIDSLFGHDKNIDSDYVNNMNSFYARFEDNDCDCNVSLCISPDDDNTMLFLMKGK